MGVELLQFLTLFKQFLVVFVGTLCQLGAALLDNVFILCLQEDDDGVILRVVQFVHIVGRDIQKAVLPL